MAGVLPFAAAPVRAAGAATNGAVLAIDIGGLVSVGLVEDSGYTPLVAAAFVGSFSPDGRAIAHAWRGEVGSELRIRRSSGAESLLGTVPGEIESLAWSPDGRHLAIGTRVGSSSVIYRIRTNGQDLTELIDLGPRGEPFVDWHPTESRLAFVYGRDIWTMDGNGGAVTQWTQECEYPDAPGSGGDGDMSCDAAPGAIVHAYAPSSPPSWSPSGDAVLVETWPTCAGTCDDPARFLGRLDVGSTRATFIRTWPETEPGTYVGMRPQWSLDGTQYLYMTNIRGDLKTWTAPFAGGRPSKVGEYIPFDWQPCPTGRCARFDSRSRTSISLSVLASGACDALGCAVTELGVRGTLTPRLVGAPVSLVLEVRAGGSWKTVATKKATTNGRGRFSVTFPRSRPGRCRLTATFRGDKDHRASRSVRESAC